ncbi:hypothetical protein SAMN05421664_0289 [Chryseobacterium soldanellicola]|uniref:Uncharacterized protein n=1 Tax=Chryseobacterium soldanellicola TaxID=311333 RepID=A0A1H0XVD8_9FLAO|nr:hypothetical protein SAMN05421664_0289 [Chryseobacterium soldanellicola]
MTTIVGLSLYVESLVKILNLDKASAVDEATKT